MSSILNGEHIKDLEPEVRNVIKKFMGFSEPALLSAALAAIMQGGGTERIIVKLATLVDYKKAEKLASRIWDVVDDFCISRELSVTRKRPLESLPRPSEPSPKKPSMMTPDEIRSMMSNTMKELQKRKQEMNTTSSSSSASSNKVPVASNNENKRSSNISSNNNTTSTNGQSKKSLPSPGLALAPPTAFMDDKAKTIAALQAQIANKMEKMKESIKPQGLILNEKGRMVDTSGQEIQMMQHTPTLKANLRALKKDDPKDPKEAPSSGPNKFEAPPDPSIKFFDPRLAKKTAQRGKKAFSFHEPGKFQIEGNRMRMKAQLERLQAGISTTARKTGITSAAQLAKLVPKGDGKDRVPDVEWWDQLIIKENNSYEPGEIREEAITNLIEHPIQLQPLESSKVSQVSVFLTKKERKKLRRQNRREAWKEKQDKIRLGLIDADQPKVKLSNLMRVLGNEAVQDPTKVEAHVREQMAKRLATHTQMNEERKLTPEQRKEKLVRKLKEDTSGGVNVAVYRVKSLANQSKKFKVETNAKQLYLTGSIVLYEDVNVVVVEGGPKQQKKYRQLMLHRIKWDEETYKDKDGLECMNNCVLVWEGEIKERSFPDFKFKACPSEIFAREYFKKCGVEHYWDQAYSEAVVEASENV
eukprot:TRINITY_DN4580_c0_g1_i1.p1 TRINITY_DN4580_c0_g1~~TRINITY_DN4580_c0_g1_i1.p1  ORF type:complete len:642 (+),score=245.78 TRINITY_DN4580_c0_g1_i1:85-2010(+)